MDAIDLKILRALQKNARRKNSELARELDMPATTLQERVRRLEQRGAISGYRALLDLEQVGLNTHAFIAVSLERHEMNFIEDFETLIQDIPQIRSCYHLAGRFDYLLHVAARDLKHMGALIKQRVASIPGIRNVETFIVLSDVKADVGWHLGEELVPNSRNRSDG